MPGNTPLTNTPYPLLTDSANIETAVQPAVKQLEKYSVPRFSSVSARNAAFVDSPPSLGQLAYVESRGFGGYTMWNGTGWEEFGEYTRLRTQYATRYPLDHLSRTSTLFGNATGYSLSLPVGIWKIGLDLYYSAPSNAGLRVNFNFPGASSSMSFGIMGRGSSASGGGPDGSTIYTEAMGSRTSGNVTENAGLGGTGSGNALYACGSGLLDLKTGGTLQLTFARVGASGEVLIRNATILSATRIG